MTFEDLQRAIADPPPRPLMDFDRSPRGKRGAAVLMLFSETPDPEIVFIRRASTLRSHAGQMALPGGRIDDVDGGPVRAALREAEEEVGVEPDAVSVMGKLPPLWVPVSNYDVTTVLGTWPGGELSAVDIAETASVHQYPLSRLTARDVRVTCEHPRGFRGPAFTLPDSFIWGLTAHLLDWVLDLGGWNTGWERDQVVPIPDEYLRD
ncbi:MAG: CoA pyrophosphatase [Propionibacterium sp.]|nr:CoA pyrophosphatase [Propionibacterium sp.]